MSAARALVRRPRVCCILAMLPSLQPTATAFAAGFPEARTFNLLDDSLSVDVEATGLDERMHERFVALGRYASVRQRADAILFTCSAFGSPIERVQADLSIPVLKPNEALQRRAVAAGGTIGALAMFASTLPSICAELEQMASASGSAPLAVEPRFVPDALAALQQGDPASCADAIAAAAVSVCAERPEISTLALTMFSMAFARPEVEAALAAKVGRPITVLTSPAAAVEDLKERLSAECELY